MLVTGFHLCARPPGESITKVLVGSNWYWIGNMSRDVILVLGAFEVGDGLHTTDADGVIGPWIMLMLSQVSYVSEAPPGTQMMGPNRTSAHLSSNTRRTDVIDNSAQLEQLNAAINFLRIEVHIMGERSADRSTELDQLFQKL